MKPEPGSFRYWLRITAWVILALCALALFCLLILLLALKIANHTNGTIISNGEARKYLLYVPESYDPAIPVPLVITIHGFAQWPAHQAHISEWNELADEEGFIVVYPSGTQFPRRWEASAVNYPDPTENPDVQFISDLIDTLEGQYNIDPTRIYVNGLSNGGAMTYLLGCVLSDRIAATGSVAGAYLFPLQDCHPDHTMPMIVFHGTADPIVPYTGGPSSHFDIPFANIPQWVEERAELNGCGTQSNTTLSDSVEVVHYSDCSQSAEVIFYSIAGGGHAWPGGKPIPEWIVGNNPTTPDATRLMWQFFQHYSLP
jgi:polyhydroxybutyrate depolymerase